ncbi:MAG: hypothetical protein ABF791_05655 [Acetobacter sp.]|uniref:hypothetical protein n=1 Tax=Acetobacter sp. TaxID=440 RepID=UPI0039E926D6
MSQIQTALTGLPRRRVLTGVLALAGSAPHALAAPGAPDDAELLQVVTAGLATNAALCHLCNVWRHEVEMPGHVEAQESVLEDALLNAQDNAGRLHAKTLAGLQAKARLAFTTMAFNRDGKVSPGNPGFLTWSLCCDLLGIAE